MLNGLLPDASQRTPATQSTCFIDIEPAVFDWQPQATSKLERHVGSQQPCAFGRKWESGGSRFIGVVDGIAVGLRRLNPELVLPIAIASPDREPVRLVPGNLADVE